MTTYQFAGAYGPEQVTNSAGRPLAALSVEVFIHGTTTLATLYTDRTKATTAPNPLTTDSVGNLTFFADPGQYDVVGNSATITVSLGLDAAEPSTGDVTGAIGKTLVDTANVESVLGASATIAAKAPLVSPALTGTPTAPTPAGADNTTKLATTAFVQGAVSGGGAVPSVFGRTGAVTATNGDYSVGQVTGAAPLASPALTGTPTAPTAAVGTNTTQLATTAFVQAAEYVNVVMTSFTTNAYTLALTDAQSAQQASNGATAATVTVPANASVAFPIGTVITLTQTATGKIQIAAAGGVTIISSVSGGFVSGTTGCRAQYSTIGLLKTTTNSWILSGDAA